MKTYIATFLLLFMFSCQQEKKNNTVVQVSQDYDLAHDFFKNDNTDSSFIYFNKAKEKFLLAGDSVKAAKSLIYMAIISGRRGDFFGSQEISLSAIQYLDSTVKEQREILSSNYNNLGKTANRLKNYNQATDFYLRSIELSEDEDSKNIYLNNYAINLTDKLEYDNSLKYFRQLLASKRIKENPVTFSRILSNHAKTKWLQDNNYNPVPDFLKALHIRQADSDLWGQNASYAHLTDFYMNKRPDSALFYAHKMLQVAQLLNSADDEVYALERLIALSPLEQSRRYFTRYKNLEDSIETDRNAAKNQFAVIRYETEKSKTENLELQKENAEKKYQINIQQFLIIGVVTLTIAGAIISSLWYKKRKQKQELEKQNAVKEIQLKTSKRVHDVVANGLYTMMSELENRDELDKENILDGIEALYEQSRDISYEENATVAPDFKTAIDDLISSFSSDERRVSLVGNEDEVWGELDDGIKHEVIHVIQELMVNMKKHSGAQNVVVRFVKAGRQINIYYSDDGIGITGTPKYKNGLTNTENRIKGISGQITFDTKNVKGLNINISFPTT